MSAESSARRVEALNSQDDSAPSHFPPEILAQLKEFADLVAIVERRLPLHRSGNKFLSRCIHHKPDNHPSMQIDPTSKRIHCFACGYHDDVLGFIQRYENLNFPEAVRLVAEEAGFDLPLTAHPSEDSRENDRLAASLLQINTVASAFFQSQLHEAGAEMARDYLVRRRIARESLQTFSIGYASSNCSQMLWRRLGQDFPPEEIEKSGLFTRRSSSLNAPRQCLLRERLIFPICDERGKVVGFSGRALRDKRPKYLNTPETVVFQKRRAMYGLHLSKGYIKALEHCIIVEGQIDLISLYQAGLQNIVASSGTSFTPYQARILSRFCRHAVAAFDPDVAGRKATEKLILQLLAEDFEIKILELPEGLDPDAALQTKGRDFIDRAMRTARWWLPWLLAHVRGREAVDSPQAKAAAATYVAPFLSAVRDPVLEDELEKQAAAVIDISKNALHHRVLAVADSSSRAITNDALKHAQAMPPTPPSSSPNANSPDEFEVPPEYSDDSLAIRLVEAHGANLRFTAEWNRWSEWDGKRWAWDRSLHVLDLARKTCRAAGYECGNERLARKIKSGATIAATLNLAKSARSVAATVDQWDSEDWVLNTPSGEVNLRTGELSAHRRESYCMKITAVGPYGDCPLWLTFLDRVTAHDIELQAFIQRWTGYCLTGSTKEQCLAFLYGTGANGKSVFLTTLSSVLGDYARVAPIQTFTASHNDQHPTDLAGLQGARLVTAIETEEGRQWAESRLKTLTGSDKISARYMRCDFFEFTPKFKLLIAGNHRPALRSVDEAIRRRILLIPFTVTIPPAERDADLLVKLQAEWPGILSWALHGCLEWQRRGLAPPQVVLDATQDYMAAEDSLGRWLEENCVVSKACETTVATLFADWQQWCEQTKEFVGTIKRFSQTLESRGFNAVRMGSLGARGFRGLGLRTDMREE